MVGSSPYLFPFYLLNRTILSAQPKLDPIITNVILMFALAIVYYVFTLMMIDQVIAWLPKSGPLQEILYELQYLF